MQEDEKNLLIIIPTYNELNNVNNLYSSLRNVDKSIEILFVDDNSPDGTGELLKKLSASDSKVTVLNRPTKMGIGSAHIDGIFYAYKNKYKYVITMDSDLTHSPGYISAFYSKKDLYDVVVGSRYLQTDSLKNWNIFRKFLTNLGHYATKYLLGMPYDATGGFRLYSLSKIDINLFKKIESKSYSFFFESLYRLHIENHSIYEIPTQLPARAYGSSKMKFYDVMLSFRMLIKLFLIKLIKIKSK